MPRKKTIHPGGQYLRDLRDARGLTQTELGVAIGYKKDKEIHEIEHGIRKLLVDDLIRIEYALKLSLTERRRLRASFGLEDPLDLEVSQHENPDIHRFIDQYRVAAESENKMAHFWAVSTFYQAIATYTDIAATNGFEFFPPDHDFVMEYLYGLAHAGDWIHAVSWDEQEEWDEALQGGRCLEFNVDAVRRGATVERIFIYRDSDELRGLTKILTAQYRRGIKILVADTSKLHNVDYQNRLVINTAQYGKFTAYPEHTEGKLLKAYISWDQRKTEEFDRIYRIIRSVSTDWKEPMA